MSCLLKEIKKMFSEQILKEMFDRGNIIITTRKEVDLGEYYSTEEGKIKRIRAKIEAEYSQKGIILDVTLVIDKYLPVSELSFLERLITTLKGKKRRWIDSSYKQIYSIKISENDLLNEEKMRHIDIEIYRAIVQNLIFETISKNIGLSPYRRINVEEIDIKKYLDEIKEPLREIIPYAFQ